MKNKKEKSLEKRIRKEYKNIIFNLLFAIFTLVFVVIFYKYILLTTFILIAISIMGLLKWRSRVTFAIFIFGGFFGAFAGIIAINYNVWNYTKINFINIPFWLFIVWGNASAFIYQTSLEIKRLGVKEK
ncbi:MAG: hypothetical protein Q8N99_06220 [Nanoarchaeota archaeon]|nr:hypothetical protein [Nanoarchaeota archaeon]